MMPSEDGNAVLIIFKNGKTQLISILRRPLPRGTGTTIFYSCPWCQKPRRHLYRLTLSRGDLVAHLGLRCQVCAGLRFTSQGRYRGRGERELVALFYQGRRTSEPRPRRPWDPRAVSDPRLVAQELFQLEEAL